MRFESAIAFGLMLGGVTFAADHPRASPAAKAVKTAPPPKPLDLRVGSVRNYMMPNELRAALSGARCRKEHRHRRRRARAAAAEIGAARSESALRAVLGARESAAGMEGFCARPEPRRRPDRPTSYHRPSSAGDLRKAGIRCRCKKWGLALMSKAAPSFTGANPHFLHRHLYPRVAMALIESRSSVAALRAASAKFSARARVQDRA